MLKVLFRTLPGRAIVIGVAVRLADLLLGLALGRVPAFVQTIDMVASVVVAAAALYLLARELAPMKRRLLWWVRGRLIISYIFIGFVPALLLLAFGALGGILLFFNFGAYLVGSEFRTLDARVRAVATAAARDIERAGVGSTDDVLGRYQASAAESLPGLRLSLVAVDALCAGPAIPAWVGCGGFSGLLRDPLAVRTVVFPGGPSPAYGIVADLPVSDAIRERVRQSTGVELGIGPATPDSPTLTSIAYLESFDRTSGGPATLPLEIRLGLGDIYRRISATPGTGGTQNVVIFLFVLVGGLFLIIEVTALAAGLSLARSITGSVDELLTGTGLIRGGDLKHRIAVEADDQLGDLARSFNAMTDSIEDLLKQSAEKKRLEEELRIARDIQISLLPQGPLRMPGVSVSARCLPANEVGGDYYDFLPLDDHRFGLIIADVAGKGAFAALYMAELKGLVLALSRTYTSPRELLIHANRLIAAHLGASSFITITYALVDLQEGTMTYARAGHTPLMHVPGPGGAGDGLTQVLTPDGLVLGLKLDGGEMFERLLDEQTVQLRAGDLFLFFTDGLSEAMDVSDDPYGEARLAGVIEQYAHLPCEELGDRVFQAIAAFVGSAAQHDDMTMILLKIDNLAGISRCA